MAHQESTIVIRRNVSLEPYNSLAVTAVADFLVEVDSLLALREAMEFANTKKLPRLVLGEGSNSVFSGDFEGLVILNRILGRELVADNDAWVELKVGAGENWHSLVKYTLTKKWFGLQNLALIPGMAGAAPMQNIGAYGVELSDLLTSVDCIEIASGKLKTLSNQECNFAYRESIFKHELRNKVIITSINLRLQKQASVNISYPSLASCFTGLPSPHEVFDAVCAIRSVKLPMPSDIPNAGSFFKNPIVSAKHRNSLLASYPDLVSFTVGADYKLAAGWLIEKAGWKQKNFDGVRVHQEQALVIVNPNRRPGSSVIQFAQKIQADIAEKFDVTLEIEPRIHGQILSLKGAENNSNN